MLNAKRTVHHLLLFSLLVNPTLNANQEPWYKNGWKVAAAGWGVGAVCLASLGAYVYLHYKKLNDEKKSNPILFHLRFKSKEVLKITQAASPYFLAAGTAFGLAAVALYRHGTQQK